MPRKKIMDSTKVIVTKQGKVVLENKTNPHRNIALRVRVCLETYDGKDSVDIHKLRPREIDIYYRYQYISQDDELGEVIRWTVWKEYPKDQIQFQGKTKRGK